MDMSSPVREQIYSAIRTFTSATVAEAEGATQAIMRIVDNALPFRANEDLSHDFEDHDCGEDTCVCRD